MRRRVRKSKNINEVDVLNGLWVRPMRRGCDRREQSFSVRPMHKDVAKQPSAGLWVRPMRRGCCEATIRGLWVRPMRRGCDRREQSFSVRPMHKDVAKQPSAGLWVRPMRRGCDHREQSFSVRPMRRGCDHREQSSGLGCCEATIHNALI